MKHRFWYDGGNDIVRMFFIGDVTVEECSEIAEILGALPEEKRRHILIDVQETRTSAFMNRDIRKAFSDKFKSLGKNKTAIVGATPVIRMLVKALIAMIGTSDVSQFFATEEEALAWLKG